MAYAIHKKDKTSDGHLRAKCNAVHPATVSRWSGVTCKNCLKYKYLTTYVPGIGYGKNKE